MNGGLTSLMVHLMNQGESRKKQEARNAQQEKILQQREEFAQTQRQSLWDHQEAARIADKLDNRNYDAARAAKQIDDKRQQEFSDLRQGAEAMSYLASTNTPWNDLKGNHQAAIVA